MILALMMHFSDSVRIISPKTLRNRTLGSFALRGWEWVGIMLNTFNVYNSNEYNYAAVILGLVGV